MTSKTPSTEQTIQEHLARHNRGDSLIAWTRVRADLDLLVIVRRTYSRQTVGVLNLDAATITGDELVGDTRGDVARALDHVANRWRTIVALVESGDEPRARDLYPNATVDAVLAAIGFNVCRHCGAQDHVAGDPSTYCARAAAEYAQAGALEELLQAAVDEPVHNGVRRIAGTDAVWEPASETDLVELAKRYRITIAQATTIAQRTAGAPFTVDRDEDHDAHVFVSYGGSAITRATELVIDADGTVAGEEL